LLLQEGGQHHADDIREQLAALCVSATSGGTGLAHLEWDHTALGIHNA
jgi:hypothetical protein